MPWKDEKDRKKDRREGLKEAARELKQGNVRDAGGLAKAALKNKNVDPDERL